MKLELAPQHLRDGYDRPSKLEVLYFTDPDCSWCWATEPVVKKIGSVYGEQVRLVYKMGGLLETWDTFYDSRNQIGLPEQVAPHWVEVARASGMPIDERIWYDDPPQSTYPGCIAYRAAFLQDEFLAEIFLRRLREAVMTERRNISRESVLFELAEPFDFDMERFRFDYRAGEAREAFFRDIAEARGRGISGFPTMVVVNADGQEITLHGYRPFADYENAFRRLAGEELHKNPPPTVAAFVILAGRVATQEVAVVCELDRAAALAELEKLAGDGLLVKEILAGGEFWSVRKAPRPANIGRGAGGTPDSN